MHQQQDGLFSAFSLVEHRVKSARETSTFLLSTGNQRKVSHSNELLLIEKMLDENNLFQQAAVASSAYASMAAFTAAANMYSSFYPATANPDPNNYLGCSGEEIYFGLN